jgi:hypothetical protein
MFCVSCYLKDDGDESTEILRSSWRWRKGDLPLFMSSNRCIPVKNILPGISIVYCQWAVIELFCILLLVTAVHKLDCRLVIKKTETHDDDRICTFSTYRRREC